MTNRERQLLSWRNVFYGKVVEAIGTHEEAKIFYEELGVLGVDLTDEFIMNKIADDNTIIQRWVIMFKMGFISELAKVIKLHREMPNDGRVFDEAEILNQLRGLEPIEKKEVATVLTRGGINIQDPNEISKLGQNPQTIAYIRKMIEVGLYRVVDLIHK